MRYTNVIAIKDIIILEKLKKKKILLGSITDITALAEIA